MVASACSAGGDLDSSRHNVKIPPNDIVRGVASRSSAPWPAGMKVLVVDDDPVCLEVVSQMLQKCNYKADVFATSGGTIEGIGLRDLGPHPRLLSGYQQTDARKGSAVSSGGCTPPTAAPATNSDHGCTTAAIPHADASSCSSRCASTATHCIVVSPF